MSGAKKDRLASGYKVTISFSCPMGMVYAIDGFGKEKMLTGYTAILKLLIRYGLIYNQILTNEAQEKAKARRAKREAAEKAKKKAKPKTPSKTAKK